MMQQTLKRAFVLMIMPMLVATSRADDNQVNLSQLTLGEPVSNAWADLLCGVSYKLSWYENRITGVVDSDETPKSHSQLITDYQSEPNPASGCNKTFNDSPLNHGGYLTHALESFGNQYAVYLNTDPVDVTLTTEEVKALKIGLRDSIAYNIEATLLLGNEDLINGLRRFRKSDDDPRTHVELLEDGANRFQYTLKLVMDNFITYPELFREQSQNDDAFGFVESAQIINGYDENSDPNITLEKRQISNDLMNLMNLMNRYALAASSEAKYLFYKKNVKDVDHIPLRNFPGPEDLDINGNGIKDQAGRVDAAVKAKHAGNNFYLQALAMSTVQSEQNFYDNNGFEVKRHLNDISRLYSDIQSGFNPMKLAGDFVPYQRVENFIGYAKSRIEAAAESEADAKSSQRTFEQFEDQLKTELLSQKERYLDQLYALTGVDPAPYVQTILSKEGREEFIQQADLSVGNNLGSIGTMLFDLEEAKLQIRQQQQQLENIDSQIKIEESRNEALTQLVMADGREISALTYSNAMATCCSWTTTISTSGGVSLTQGPFAQASYSRTLNRNPNLNKLARGQSALALLQSTQQARVDNINSASQVKRMLLEQATVYVSLELAINNLNRQIARVEEQWESIDRLIANYAQARENLAGAYYLDPSYRLEASQFESIAEDDFATALESTYYAAKALEYVWSEKFNNPILRLDGGLPEPLSPSYDSFQRAESVFSADFAAKQDKSIGRFYNALYEWDLKMRQSRFPETQKARVRLSMRDDLLGYGNYSPDIAEKKFESFIQNNMRIGDSKTGLDLLFGFTMGIGDESLFPAHPNLKIESINLNLVSNATRSVRGSYRMDPALVDLVMLDRAYVRTFFSEYPALDDILTYQLQEGRTIDKSPFIATVEASIDGYASPIPITNTQLANHSPAVSQWMLRIKNNRLNNQNLDLQYLSDIEMEIEYSYGKPRDIAIQPVQVQ